MSYPDPVAIVARKSGPEKASARVRDPALGAAGPVEVAAPVGSAVTVERAVPTAAACLWLGLERR